MIRLAPILFHAPSFGHTRSNLDDIGTDRLSLIRRYPAPAAPDPDAGDLIQSQQPSQVHSVPVVLTRSLARHYSFDRATTSHRKPPSDRGRASLTLSGRPRSSATGPDSSPSQEGSRSDQQPVRTETLRRSPPIR